MSARVKHRPDPAWLQSISARRLEAWRLEAVAQIRAAASGADERPFRCDRCPARFATEWMLAAHRVQHRSREKALETRRARQPTRAE